MLIGRDGLAQTCSLKTRIICDHDRAPPVTFSDNARTALWKCLPSRGHHIAEVQQFAVGVQDVQVIRSHALGQRTRPIFGVNVFTEARGQAGDINGLIARRGVIGDRFSVLAGGSRGDKRRERGVNWDLLLRLQM